MVSRGMPITKFHFPCAILSNCVVDRRTECSEGRARIPPLWVAPSGHAAPPPGVKGASLPNREGREGGVKHEAS